MLTCRLFVNADSQEGGFTGGALSEEEAEVRVAGLWDRVRSIICLLYTSPSPRDGLLSRMPSSA